MLEWLTRGSFPIRIPELSNSGCRPGKFGGSPTFTLADHRPQSRHPPLALRTIASKPAPRSAAARGHPMWHALCARPGGRIAGLGATRDFHHGLLRLELKGVHRDLALRPQLRKGIASPGGVQIIPLTNRDIRWARWVEYFPSEYLNPECAVKNWSSSQIGVPRKPDSEEATGWFSTDSNEPI